MGKEHLDADRLPATQTPAERCGLLAGRRVAFTGRLTTPQRELFARIRAAGAQPFATVSNRTDILVIGLESWPLQPDGRVNRNIARAASLLETSDRPKVHDEAALLTLLRMPAPPRRYHSPETTQRILGIDESTLQGLQPHEPLRRDGAGNFDARDVSALRTLADLRRRGVADETVLESLEALDRLLPVARDDLDHARHLVRNARGLLDRVGDPLIASDGQMLLGFGAAPDVEPVVLSFRPRDLTASDWLERALQLEEAERLDEAAEACRRAIALDAGHSEALFNLGNVIRASGRDDAALELYRLAAAIDAGAAHAWYNIADVEQSQGRLEAAVESLRAALRIAPDYADAHYNTARLLELLGRRDEAGAHWSRYLALDSTSEWADTARRHLAARELERRVPGAHNTKRGLVRGT